jgi:sarcosine oxidase
MPAGSGSFFPNNESSLKQKFDAIVIGLGAMGSATAYHLSLAGKRVLGLDRFEPPHTQGSSHGLTRIIREAYFEHPSYVPLIQRAYELWTDLEQKSGRKLLLKTGGLMIGPPDGALVAGARRSAEEHKLPHEILSAAELNRRVPAFRPAEDMVAVAEPRAGILFPEAAVRTHLQIAAEKGAIFRFNEPVLSWETHEGGVLVSSATDRYHANRLIISAGPWAKTLLSDLHLPLTTERQVLCWFEPRVKPELFKPESFPIYICQYAARGFFYGFPDLGDGFKVAMHHGGQTVGVGDTRREADETDISPVRELLRQYLPDANGPLRSATVCLYTNAPDEHFILGPHPKHPEVIIVSPCSGHGFKFSPVIGEVVAGMVTGAPSAFDLSLFRPDRFGL